MTSAHVKLLQIVMIYIVNVRKSPIRTKRSLYIGNPDIKALPTKQQFEFAQHVMPAIVIAEQAARFQPAA